MSEKVRSPITLEAWDPALKPNLDWNHAWGAAPSNIIARQLMGIEPLEPGFRRFRVRPQTATLEKARIKMPTPKGPVTLRTSGTEAAGWTADLTVPTGTAAEFHLPFSGEGKVEGAGEPVLLRVERGRQVLELRPGKWSIRMAGQ